MEGANLHLAFNHFPVIASIIGMFVLGWGLLRKDNSVTNVGLVLIVVTGIVAIPVYLTGEPAEEIVEGLPGVLEDLIHTHEDFAKFALATAIISGIIALVALIYKNIKPQGTFGKVLLVLTFVLSVFTVGMVGWTAKLGGVIRHTEIRANSAPANPVESETKSGKDSKQEEEKNKEKEKDDDDH